MTRKHEKSYLLFEHLTYLKYFLNYLLSLAISHLSFLLNELTKLCYFRIVCIKYN
jgi:hypothetical protein